MSKATHLREALNAAEDQIRILTAERDEALKERWTCFHCGETFTTPGAARDHFGACEGAEPGCLIDRVALEEGGTPERGRGLLMALRKAEAQLAALAPALRTLRETLVRCRLLAEECHNFDLAHDIEVQLRALLALTPEEKS